MKIFRLKYAGLFFLLLAAFSCTKKEYNATPNVVSLSQDIQKESGLSLFRQALARTGLDTVLAGGGPYTVFAPVDSAFIASGFTADKISGYPADKLRDIISFHILPGRIGSATLAGFLSDTLQSLNSRQSPIVTQNYFGTFLNGVRVVQGNINLADGVLHKLGAVCIPPSGDILATLDSLPNTKMAAYIFHQSLGLALFARTPATLFLPVPPQGGYHILDFNYATPYYSSTMLIPSDDAFKAYGYNNISDLAAVDTVHRTNMLASCILYGSYFTADFMGGRSVGNLGNGSSPGGQQPIGNFANNGSVGIITANNQWNYYNLWLTNGNYEIANDGLTINGSGVSVSPRIIQPNIVTTTGVVHIIDQVFAPNGGYSPKGPQ
ncbi:MAG: fasciclin domain-containing protein [Chitinophagaceae bacterium]|nr:fasciclin domain-containing protein [Chitinophagaceae bacterium]